MSDPKDAVRLRHMLDRDKDMTSLLIPHKPVIAARARRQLTLCDWVLSG